MNSKLLDLAGGSNFLGTNLDWFEANWILELDCILVPSLILGSPNQMWLNCIRNNAGTSQLCTVHIQEVGEVCEAIASGLPLHLEMSQFAVLYENPDPCQCRGVPSSWPIPPQISQSPWLVGSSILTSLFIFPHFGDGALVAITNFISEYPPLSILPSYFLGNRCRLCIKVSSQISSWELPIILSLVSWCRVFKTMFQPRCPNKG